MGSEESIAELRKRAREAGLAYRYISSSSGTDVCQVPADVLRLRLRVMGGGAEAATAAGWELGELECWALGDGAARPEAAPTARELRECGLPAAEPEPEPAADEAIDVDAAITRAIDARRAGTDGATVRVVPMPESAPVRAAKSEPVTDVETAAAALARALGASRPNVGREMVEAIVAERVAEALASVPARVHEWRDGAGRIVAKVDGLVHRMLPEVVEALRVAPPVLLVGPAGSGKSSLLRAAARVLGVPCVEVCMSAAVSESQLLGAVRPGTDGTWREVPGPVVTACERGALLILDELDGADPNVGVALHAALDERTPHVFAPGLGRSVLKADGYVVGACANTWGRGADAQYVGRSPLDVATLDRFSGSVLRVDYDADLEAQVAPADVRKWAEQVRGVIGSAGLRRVVSTRLLARLGRYRAAGMAMPACRARALAGWTDAELARLPAGCR